MKRLQTPWVWGLMLAACAWGLFLRTYNLRTRPFWADEAWVADTVTKLSYGELLRQTDVPLPPLFGVLLRFMLGRGTPPEVWLRLLPAVCGVLALPGVYAVARLLRGTRALALAATGLCASSIMLVIWSRELKQYSFEGLVSVLAALLVFGARRSGARTRWIIGAALVALCLVAPWWGYGSVFPLAAITPFLLIGRPLVGSRRSLIAVGLASLVGLAVSLAVLRTTVAGAQAANPSLAEFTSKWYLNLGDSKSWARIGQWTSHATICTVLPTDWFLPVTSDWGTLKLMGTAVLLWLLALLGVFFWPRHGRLELAWWLAAPLLLMLCAAILHVYPFGQARMMQFWAAPMLVAVTSGAVGLWRHGWMLCTDRAGPALACGMLIGLLPAPYVLRVPLQHRYHYCHNFPAVLKALAEQRAAGEMVLVTMSAVSCVRYYAPDLPPPVIYAPTTAGVVQPVEADYGDVAEHAAELAGRRLWLLSVWRPQVRGATIRALQERGYVVRVAASSGPDGLHGQAALLVAEWR